MSNETNEILTIAGKLVRVAHADLVCCRTMCCLYAECYKAKIALCRRCKECDAYFVPAEDTEADLEAEVKRYFQGHWPGMETAEQCNTDMGFTPLAIMRLVRHFAKWGAEHLKK